jgi:hypothetical protein
MASPTRRARDRAWGVGATAATQTVLTAPRASGIFAPMTAEGVLKQGAAIEPAAEADDGPLYCYRHPKSETYVRCGRCDQPICPKCAVQGPVGFRCRQCGLVKSATISSFTPRQLALGLGVSLGGGVLVGYLGGQLGFYSIFLSFFAGAFLAEAFVRVAGLKRGPIVRTMLYGGLLAGFVLGALVQVVTFLGGLPAEAQMPMQLWLQTMLPYIAIGLGATLAGAYSRVRWF